MSVRIGSVDKLGFVEPAVHVLASTGVVELHSDEHINLTPAAARTYATLLERAADEAERMRQVSIDPETVRATSRYAETRSAYTQAVAAMQNTNYSREARERLAIAINDQAAAAIALAELIVKD